MEHLVEWQKAHLRGYADNFQSQDRRLNGKRLEVTVLVKIFLVAKADERRFLWDSKTN